MDKEWKIEKYARFMQPENSQITLSQSSGKWQLCSSTTEKRLRMCITQPLNLILRANDEVLESFNLIKSSSWLKVIARNDSMLFLCKFEEKIRRFRVKFAGESPDINGVQSCREFIVLISKHVNVQIVTTEDGKMEDNTHNIAEHLTIKTVTESVLKDRFSDLPAYYQTSNLSRQHNCSDEANTSSLIKTCLLDPNFPSFVESVEKSLNEMMECS